MRSLLALSTCLLAVVVASGCSAGSSPQAVGPNPSPISIEVCSTEARTEITGALGELATIGVDADLEWAAVYACDYTFPQGTIRMSVKELSSKSQTTAYFSDLAHQFGDKQTLYALGQAAFLTDNGSVVVRKDWKVLLVDSTRLRVRSRPPPCSQAHRPRPWRRSSWHVGPVTRGRTPRSSLVVNHGGRATRTVG